MFSKTQFRFWNKLSKKMQEVTYVDWQTKEVYIGEDLEDLVDGVLLEYTGKKDKKGREIYEGDILKIKTGVDVIIGDVFYDSQDYSRFQVRHPEGCHSRFGLNRDTDVVATCEVFEIIGNIYENPDIINKIL
jgi:uncharacterized phage protein (TIGR01671 family)